MDPRSIALEFESLSGGCIDGTRWGFGCEFGLFQRELGAEPIGLLRWSSIGPHELIAALDEDFARIDRPDELILWGEGHWNYTHRSYLIRVDHSDFEIAKVSEDEARRGLCVMLGFLRDKLLEDLAAGEKIFVYRMLDEIAEPELITRLAASVSRHGPGTLLFCQAGERDEVRRLAPNLLLGTATRYASNGENKGFDWQWDKWMRLSREALELTGRLG